MDQTKLYREISQRLDGDIYIGVVGPVRSGKSSFVKRFMELIVLPNIESAAKRERATDELPVSGAGKQITTTEPKFVPNEGIQVNLKDGASFRVRLVDSVGFMVPGALGAEEEAGARMVRTPWFDHDIPFEEAAEIGTRKVISDHSCVGIVVTTDGSIADIDRSAYEEAEEKCVRELKALKKPFIVLVNAKDPENTETTRLAGSLREKYSVPVLCMNVLTMRTNDINELMETILFEFPLTQINFSVPSWLSALEDSHYLVESILSFLRSTAPSLSRMRDYEALIGEAKKNEYIQDARSVEMRLSEGLIEIKADLNDDLYFKVLGEASGQNVEGEEHLLKLMKELVDAKREYDRVKDALESVKTTGYGLVPPEMNELTLEEPQIVKQGNRFGVKLRAGAPSLHMIRVDIATEVSPIVGTEKQSEELVKNLLSGFEGDPKSLWETEIFGRSLSELVREGLSGKLMRMPDDIRIKVQKTLTKIINEGNGGIICILL